MASPRCCCTQQDSTVLYVALSPGGCGFCVALQAPNATFPVHLLLREPTSELASQSPSSELVLCVLWSCMNHIHKL